MAAQVEPPLQDKEMIPMFIDTLQYPFYKHVLGSFSSNFSDIVIIKEMVEFGLKIQKIAHGPFAVANPKIPDLEGKEGEVQVTYNIPHYDSHASPVPENSYQQNLKIKMKSKQDQSLHSTPIKGSNRKKKVVQFTPIVMTYTKLLPQLLNEGLVAICHLNPLQTLKFKTYDPSAKCDYHNGVFGHST